jgi:fluoride ion exporter CrcB/FEX
MDPYRTAVPVAEDDLDALIREARDDVRRKALEARLDRLDAYFRVSRREVWFRTTSILTRDDGGWESIGSVVVRLAAAPFVGTFIVIAWFAVLAVGAVVRAWTELRLHGRAARGFPLGSTLVCIAAPMACAPCVVAWTRGTFVDPATLVAALAWGFGMLVALTRREWSTRAERGA